MQHIHPSSGSTTAVANSSPTDAQGSHEYFAEFGPEMIWQKYAAPTSTRYPQQEIHTTFLVSNKKNDEASYSFILSSTCSGSWMLICIMMQDIAYWKMLKATVAKDNITATCSNIEFGRILGYGRLLLSGSNPLYKICCCLKAPETPFNAAILLIAKCWPNLSLLTADLHYCI